MISAYYENGGICLYHGDCLEVMPLLESGSIDMVLTDPPYGTTACKWDSIIPLEPMWVCLKRLAKKNAAIVMTASQPFTSVLTMSNVAMFKHEWVWIKNRGSNFANTVREPMKEHESVLVFSQGKWTYNKQMQERTGGGLGMVGQNQTRKTRTENYGKMTDYERVLPELRVPSSWQKYNTEVGLHPTQKPVALMEYLIKTYTNEGDTVLDFTMGSGTTGVACKNLNRKFIGIEMDEGYAEIAANRIRHC
jgi:site-specific DNA-methyltransferase (adenine-specific)